MQTNWDCFKIKGCNRMPCFLQLTLPVQDSCSLCSARPSALVRLLSTGFSSGQLLPSRNHLKYDLTHGLLYSQEAVCARKNCQPTDFRWRFQDPNSSSLRLLRIRQLVLLVFVNLPSVEHYRFRFARLPEMRRVVCLFLLKLISPT